MRNFHYVLIILTGLLNSCVSVEKSINDAIGQGNQVVPFSELYRSTIIKELNGPLEIDLSGGGSANIRGLTSVLRETLLCKDSVNCRTHVPCDGNISKCYTSKLVDQLQLVDPTMPPDTCPQNFHLILMDMYPYIKKGSLSVSLANNPIKKLRFSKNKLITLPYSVNCRQITISAKTYDDKFITFKH